MSYQVLARKYRPRSFVEMVGQEHVLRALINALDSNRLHHAYLFTGTRGVGKTTLARLLAKCLNCETGVSSKPCETCSTCQEINAGRFVDLIEVDAASRTKVEDTRELLDNVQYAPTRGRYKVYLIDEVHMLSGHSFNALLKTLEEPPPHIKFLLATTDPQRLPITILSRCLQFNLKNLSVEKIEKQLENILQQEQIEYELPALTQLAHAAHGSMRDALSLLDQAIAFSGGKVNAGDVRELLGTIEQSHIFQLLDALVQQNPPAILSCVNQLAEQGTDFANALEELVTLLHHIALAQIIPTAIDQHYQQPEQILGLAHQFTAEDIQLFYQIGIIGRRDLPLAPSPRIGFEMTLLRMLAFRPTEAVALEEEKNSVAPAQTSPSLLASRTGVTDASPLPDTTEAWIKLIPRLNLSGFTQALATNCAVKTRIDSFLHLELDPSQSALCNSKQEARLAEALSSFFGNAIKLKITPGSPNLNTPARNKQQQQMEQLETATQAMHNDANVQTIIKIFDAKLDTHSIQTKNPAILSEDES